MPQTIYSCSPPEEHWKWKDLYSRDLQLGAKLASLQKKTMKNAKHKLEVPGYTKENITITVKTDNGAYEPLGFWNPSEKYIQVVADNDEFGRKTAELAPTSDFENVRAEVKNGILYLDWDAPKELAPVTVRVD